MTDLTFVENGIYTVKMPPEHFNNKMVHAYICKYDGMFTTIYGRLTLNGSDLHSINTSTLYNKILTIRKSTVNSESVFEILDFSVPAYNSVTTDSISDLSVTTAKLANNSVTSDKIDWATLKPYWKTVATSTSPSVTLPAGYRHYRIRLVGYKNNANNWGTIGCSQATGTTWIYIQGMSNGTWVANERSVTASSDKAVMDGARSGTAAGFQTWDIAISKPDKNGTLCLATWETGMHGSLTFNTGRSIFSVTNGTADMNLSCELSSTLWSVEAFVEN